MPHESYTDSELEAMMAALESDLVERKESFKGDNPPGSAKPSVRSPTICPTTAVRVWCSWVQTTRKAGRPGLRSRMSCCGR